MRSIGPNSLGSGEIFPEKTCGVGVGGARSSLTEFATPNISQIHVGGLLVDS